MQSIREDRAQDRLIEHAHFSQWAHLGPLGAAAYIGALFVPLGLPAAQLKTNCSSSMAVSWQCDSLQLILSQLCVLIFRSALLCPAAKELSDHVILANPVLQSDAPICCLASTGPNHPHVGNECRLSLQTCLAITAAIIISTSSPLILFAWLYLAFRQCPLHCTNCLCPHLLWRCCCCCAVFILSLSLSLPQGRPFVTRWCVFPANFWFPGNGTEVSERARLVCFCSFCFCFFFFFVFVVVVFFCCSSAAAVAA